MTSHSLKRTLFALLLMTLVGFTAQQARASHLRGQTISWAPTANPGEVEFTFNYSERYSASVPTLGSTYSVGISFGDNTTGTATGPVTSINTTDDYFIAVLKVKHTYAGSGPYTAFYNNCCRISTIKDGHDQTIQLQTTVTPRNGNHSPVTSLPVVVTVATTGTVQFTVPAADIDGDRLRFRLATSLESFATATPSGFTTQPPGFSVDQNTGVVTWNTSAISPAPIAGDLWASQIMIEDLDSSGNVRSKVPVDFILKFVATVGHLPTITLNPTGPITASANTPVSFTVTGNDVDNNARVTLNASGMPAGASMSPALGATLSPPVTSTFSWTPTLAQAGATGQTYIINFTATDDTNQQALTSITINVLPAGAPTANSQSVTTASGVPKLITLSATDPNGSSLSFNITAAPAHGAITNIGAPSCSLNGGVSTCTVDLTYTSNSGYSGPDTFSFRASNGVQNSNAANVSVTVNPGNRPPVATNSSITTNEDTSVLIPLPASDPDGNGLTYVVLSGPANGILTGSGSSRTYLPNLNYNGADSFTFKVNDGTVDSNTATVSITVDSVNDPPLAGNDSYSDIADLMLSVASPGVLSNDSDIDSSSLNAILDAGPSHGTLTLNANGSFNYLPNLGYMGSDNFTYHANDGGANSGPAIVVITVSAPACVNHPSDLVAWYPANGNAFDVIGGNNAILQNGATYAARAAGQAFDLNNDGNATNNAISDIVRVPRTTSIEPQRVSVDAWVYPRSYLWDTEGGVIISKDVIGTSAGDGASYALIGPGTTQKFNAYVHFTDGTQPRITSAHAFALNQWHHVAMTWDGNTLKLYVDGNEEASTTAGPKTIAYSNHDLGIGKHSTAGRGFDGLIDEVEIFNRALSQTEIQSLYNASSAGKCNTPAVAQDQSVTTNEDTALSIAVNAADADGNFLNYSVVAGPANGTLSGTAPNLTYTPNLNYNGSDSFTFKVNDGFTDSNTATVSINVNAVNDPPMASCRDLTLTTSGGGAACPPGMDCKKGPGTKHCKAGDPTCIPTVGSCSLNVSADQIDNGSSDPDGDGLTYTLSPAGPFTVGTTPVTLTVTDPAGASSSCTANITVIDDTSPVPIVTKLDDVTGECSATVTPPVATDNCSGPITGTTSDPTTYNQQGTYTVHWTYDDGQGNISTQNQNVIVKDVTKPVPNIASLPDVTGECSATIPSAPVANDNCAGSIIGTTTDPLAYTEQGTFTVTWHYSDGHGNESTQIQTVIVKDMTPPALSVPVDLTVNTGAGATSCSALVPDAAIGSANATDNCELQSLIRSGVPSGNIFPVGTTVLTYTATDIHGKTTTKTQRVTVVDDTLPVLNVPPNITIGTAADASSCTAFVNNGMLTPSATDNCGVDVNSFTRTGVPAGNNFPVGTTIVTYTVKDIHGNLASGTQSVTVTDATLPVITFTGKTITLWPPDHKYQTVTIADLIASATDNCDPNVTLSKVVISMVTSDEPENINGGDGNTFNDIVIAADCKSVDLRAERDGSKNGRVYTIYFQVKDSAGNMQTVKATVGVPKSQGPGGAAINDTPAYPVPPPYKVMGICPP